MARIALVQSYPYEAVSGGDAAYIAALRDYLISSGHDVIGMVTDTTRGRTLPYYVSAYDLANSKKWKVRSSIRICNLFISYDIKHLLTIFRRVFLNRKVEEDKISWDKREAYWVKRELSRQHFDVVILLFSATKFTDIVSGKWKIVSILGFLDDVFEISESQPTSEEGGRRINDDFSYLRNSTFISLNNASDIKFLESHKINNLIQINMGFPSKNSNKISIDDNSPTVIMVGAYTHPNIASCSWFLDNIWPIILKDRPDARLRLIGRISSLVETHPRDGVEGVGYVPQLEAEYNRAQVVVAPLVIGSRGVKIKVAEALSYGRALVTTSLGVDAGSPDQFSGAVAVADTAEEFATAVLALLNNSELRRERQVRALQAFEHNFSYEAAYGELMRRLEI